MMRAVEAELRAVLSSGDDYLLSAKPQIDWDDSEAEKAQIDCRARDAIALILALGGRQLSPEVTEAAALLAAVIWQDLELAADGSFAIARRVAKHRIISTGSVPETV